MLHIWLIPLLAILFVLVVLFYMVIRHSGGSGKRTDGETLAHNDTPEVQPKGNWNFYGDV